MEVCDKCIFWGNIKSHHVIFNPGEFVVRAKMQPQLQCRDILTEAQSLLCNLQENGMLTQAHLQRVKYDAEHTVGLVYRAILCNKVLDQAETTSPPGHEEETAH